MITYLMSAVALVLALMAMTVPGRKGGKFAVIACLSAVLGFAVPELGFYVLGAEFVLCALLIAVS